MERESEKRIKEQMVGRKRDLKGRGKFTRET